MAKIFFCPHCGRKFDLLCEEDLIQYKNGVCSFCGFIGDFVDVGLSYDELFSQLDDYATQKNIDIDTSFENMWRAQIEMVGIDKDPRFDWDASLKSMEEWHKKAIKAHLQGVAKRNAEKQRIAAANTLHCPTCGSTNIKKLDVVDRAVSVGFFGIFSNKINKSFKCKDCGCTW